MTTAPVAATKIIPADIHTDVNVEPEQILKKVADGAIFVSDVLVGNGAASKPGAKTTRFEDFRRHGLLGYASSVATASANLTGTAWAPGLTAFSPINWLNPVQWSVSLVNPAYWLSTAQYGEETWGKMAAGPVACASSIILGTARAPAHKLRELEDEHFPSIDVDVDVDIDGEPAPGKPAPKPEGKKPEGKKPETKPEAKPQPNKEDKPAA